MIPITPSGVWHKQPVVERPSKGKVEAKPKVSYEQYLYNECRKSKLDLKETCARHPAIAKLAQEGDEVWGVDDDKVPLCGAIGVILVRGQTVIHLETVGMH